MILYVKYCLSSALLKQHEIKSGSIKHLTTSSPLNIELHVKIGNPNFFIVVVAICGYESYYIIVFVKVYPLTVVGKDH